MTLTFDPYAHVSGWDEPEVEKAARSPADDAPREWQHGLALLRDRNRPRLAHPERWAQIISDVERILLRHAWAIAAGWDAVDLFGFDPVDPTPSLAVAMQGRTLIDITPERASMEGSDGYAWHYRHLRGPVPMLWNFDERRYRI